MRSIIVAGVISIAGWQLGLFRTSVAAQGTATASTVAAVAGNRVITAAECTAERIGTSVMPRTERSVIGTLRAQPLKSLLAGFTLLITVPIAALLLIVTVLGLPVGLVLAAAYAVALFAGVLTTAFFLGDAEARWLNPQTETTRGRQAALLLAGVLTLALLRTVLGGVAVFLAILFGLGALSVWLYQTYVRATHAPAAA